MSDILTIVEDYHARLAALEQGVIATIRAAYSAFLAAINPHLVTLYRQLQVQYTQADASESHALGTFVWLHAHLDSLLALIAAHVTSFVTSVQPALVPLLQNAAHLGIQSGAAQTNTATTIAATTTQLQAALAFLQTRAAMLAQDTTDKVRIALTSGAALGLTVHAIAKRVATALNYPQWQLIMLSTTLSWNLYRDVQQGVFAESGVSLWLWRTHAGACVFCQSMNGTKHPIGEPMHTHNSCRCDQVLIAA